MGTVPAPYTPVAGDDATQARVLTWADAANYLLGNATAGGSRRAVTILRQSVAQSLATSGTAAAVTFDAEDADYDNGHSTVTNTTRYTAQTGGIYECAYTCAFASNATGFRECYLQINGTTIVTGSFITVPAVNGQVTALAGSRKVFLNAGDYIELFALQTSTAALNTAVGSTGSYLGVEWRSV